jgi:hypothetical protein
MATVNVTFAPDIIWFVYPLIGWGIGIIAHFIFAIILAKRLLQQNEAKAEKLASGVSSNKNKNDEVNSG